MDNRLTKCIFLLYFSFIYTVLRMKYLVSADTFWHLKVGEWISSHRALPRVDMFSWTAAGEPWVAHEWLFDVAIFQFYRLLNIYGIFIFIFLITALFIFLLWKLYSRESGGYHRIVIISIVLLLLLSRYHYIGRPQILSYVFFTYFLYVLFYNKKLLLTLPFAAVIWANAHGSVVLGAAMVFLHFIYDFIYIYFTEKRFYIDKKMLIIAFLTPLASLINPYFTGLWKSSFWLITSKTNHMINEWQPPDFTELTLLIPYLLVIISLVVICFMQKNYKDAKDQILLVIYLIVTLYVSLAGVRYFPYLVICWGLFVLKNAPFKLVYASAGKRLIAFSVVLSLLPLVFLLKTGLPVKIEDMTSRFAPVEAAASLENKKTFNYYTWGGYLIFYDMPVFIDGRADIYMKNNSIFLDYMSAYFLDDDPEQILKKYGVEQVFIPSDSPLDFYLKHTDWIEKYRDHLAVIYSVK